MIPILGLREFFMYKRNANLNREEYKKEGVDYQHWGCHFAVEWYTITNVTHIYKYFYLYTFIGLLKADCVIVEHHNKR